MKPHEYDGARLRIGEARDYMLGESIEVDARALGDGQVLEIATHAEINGVLTLRAKDALELGGMIVGWAVTELGRHAKTNPHELLQQLETAQAIVREQMTRLLFGPPIS
jgi:hypothetical protein